ncbi:MAG TPA: hypothetical protein VI072_35055 [Polyangiaceae bacterium]
MRERESLSHGHQFRYSELQLTGSVQQLYRLSRPRQADVVSEGIAIKNTLASYVHAHWGSNPAVDGHARLARRGTDRRAERSDRGSRVRLDSSAYARECRSEEREHGAIFFAIRALLRPDETLESERSHLHLSHVNDDGVSQERFIGFPLAELSQNIELAKVRHE